MIYYRVSVIPVQIASSVVDKRTLFIKQSLNVNDLI